jgi:uncharacterized MAPEG superfamily protein
VTVPFWCLIIVLFVPYVLAAMGGYFRKQAFGSADNNNPRLQAAQLEGAGARCMAAQSNAWEATAVFTASVMICHLAGAGTGAAAANAAMLFVAARLAHAVFYIADQATLRSLSFVLGVACCVRLLYLAGSS